ncbi:MAG: hypothetical protein M3Q77_07530 [Thermoproteota archaeon]|nr:hypothetical protein [Thermoproteota archaeon]
MSSAVRAYSNSELSPYQKFVYALRAKESQRQYPRRLQVFLDYLKIDCDSIEEKSNILLELIEKNGRNWLENELLKFFTVQNKRAVDNEISVEKLKTNYILQ